MLPVIAPLWRGRSFAIHAAGNFVERFGSTEIFVACEETVREEGRCPFNPRCKPAWFCRHAGQCMVCDMHSCATCRISRGDGELVLSLVERLRPKRVVFDFDRTLSNTKSGQEPILGKHDVDAELLSLLQLLGGGLTDCACVVATRNPHREKIYDFLRAHGAPEQLVIHVLKRPRSKAECVVKDLGEFDKALFVDDSIAELVDPLIARDPRIHCVFFVRGLL